MPKLALSYLSSELKLAWISRFHNPVTIKWKPGLRNSYHGLSENLWLSTSLGLKLESQHKCGNKIMQVLVKRSLLLLISGGTASQEKLVLLNSLVS